MSPIYTESFVKRLYPSYLYEYTIHIPKKKIHLFPEPPAKIELEYDTLIFSAWIKSNSLGGAYIGHGLSEWFKDNRIELKEAGKITIYVDKQNNKYRLEIVK